MHSEIMIENINFSMIPAEEKIEIMCLTLNMSLRMGRCYVTRKEFIVC